MGPKVLEFLSIDCQANKFRPPLILRDGRRAVLGTAVAWISAMHLQLHVAVHLSDQWSERSVRKSFLPY